MLHWCTGSAMGQGKLHDGKSGAAHMDITSKKVKIREMGLEGGVAESVLPTRESGEVKHSWVNDRNGQLT